MGFEEVRLGGLISASLRSCDVINVLGKDRAASLLRVKILNTSTLMR